MNELILWKVTKTYVVEAPTADHAVGQTTIYTSGDFDGNGLETEVYAEPITLEEAVKMSKEVGSEYHEVWEPEEEYE